MSLLSIVKEAAAIIGLEDYSQVIGNSDSDVRQLRALLQQGGNMISNMTNADGGAWSVLERIYEFPTTENETEYDLPADFQRLITETVWQKDKYWKMRGSATPRQWEMVRNRQAKTPYNVFRILRTQNGVTQVGENQAPQVVRKFTLEPEPGENITLVYEYISNAWWVSENGEFKRRATADTDESVFGDHLHVLDLVWRFKNANSLEYASELALFEMERDRLLIQDAATEYISAGIDRRAYANKWESDVEWGWTS